MASINPAKFIREVRQEMGKVTWPTRRETGLSAFMVLVLAVIASLFFVLVDNVLSFLIKLILGLGG